MKNTAYLTFLYGTILIVMGCLGYHSAASRASLFAGVGSGCALLVTGFLTYSGRSIGGYLSLVITGALTGIFAVRYSTTGKDVPAIMAVLSAAMLIYLLLRVTPRKRR